MDNEHAAAPEQVDLKRFFQEIRTVAVVGYSDKPERAGHYVSHYLADAGYEIIALNPKFGDEVNGLRCYANLESIPPGTPVDVVDVFRAPPFVPDLARAAAQMDPKPRYFVMQPGAESEEAGQLAREAGIVPLEMCMMAMHKIWRA
jgi:predicted CoA-binding protein